MDDHRKVPVAPSALLGGEFVRMLTLCKESRAFARTYRHRFRSSFSIFRSICSSTLTAPQAGAGRKERKERKERRFCNVMCPSGTSTTGHYKLDLGNTAAAYVAQAFQLAK